MSRARPRPTAAPAAPCARLAATPAWTLTGALGLLYVILAPPSPDLAAASYRSFLFSRSGPSIWDSSWYGGHHLPAYSLLAPGLGALVGPQLLAAVSMVLATALFSALAARRFAPRPARIAGLWFAVGASVALLSCRVPFDLGLAIGLAALLAAASGHRRWALALTLLCALASPVAGAFLALAYLGWALGGRARPPAGLALAALAPIATLALVFPEGGTQPFVASAFYPALAGVLVIGAMVPAAERELRAGFALYAAAMIGSYLVPSAVGGNADRLGALCAGPVAACVLSGSPRRRRALLALAPLLLYWQANAPVVDFASAISDPATEASYYAPLLAELRSLHAGYGARPVRIEVVATADHWEARWVAPHAMMARGWERQLDRLRNPLFYTDAGGVSATSYGRWLREQGVSFVALPDAPLDYSARSEAALLRASPAPPYLRPEWSSRHWRLFAVRAPAPLAQPPATLVSADRASFALQVPSAGAYTVLVRFSPYWALAADGAGGCVERSSGDWTRVRTRTGGHVRVVIAFSLARVLGHGPRCS